MTERELIWAGGLFEGEGSFSLREVNGRFYPATSLNMTDEDPVRRFHQAMRVGTVVGPYDRGLGNKPAWTWKVTGFESVQHVVASLWFGLGDRRRARATEVLLGSSLPYVKKTHCKWGHEFTPKNTRIARGGWRICRACMARYQVEYRARKKTERAA